MDKSQQDYIQAYQRERQARDELEKLLEEKTRALFIANQELEEKIKLLQTQQAVLMQTEKMATLGTLSAGVAHEINNPLAYSTSNLESLAFIKPILSELLSASKAFIDGDISADESLEIFKRLNQQQSFEFVEADIDELLEDAQEGLRRIGATVANLLSFARPKNNLLAMGDMAESIESSLKLLSNQLKSVHLICHLQPIPQTYCNVASLNQVTVNLLLNAKQACEGLTRRAEIVIELYSKHDQIILSIEDNGCGMNDDTIAHIFEPFFTTKPVGQGTGMGMAMVYGIVNEHQGQIKISSSLGKGTKITCEFPISTPDSEQ